MTRRFLLALLLAFLGALAACTVGPDYVRPDAVPRVPDAFAEAGGAWKEASPGDRTPRGEWWRLFGDAELDRLEAEAMQGSQRLAAAAARFEQARAAADVARSGLFPRIGAGASATRQHDSEERPLATTGQAAGRGFTYNNFTLPFDLSWEPDLWGRVRRQQEAAVAREEAEAADGESVRLALSAEVAVDYLALRALDAERRFLLASVEGYARALELTRSRRAAGLVSDLDVAQAETTLRSAEAFLPPNTLSRSRFEHALAVLTGKAAPLFHIRESEAAAEIPRIPAGLPSDLLERRPDVAAAERRMAAANAGVGVAKAAFYPSLRLGAAAGFQSIDTATVLGAPSGLWAFGAAITAPLFQGGQRRASLRISWAAWDEAVARYRDVVLVAFAEVEDALAAQRLLAEEHDRLEVAAAAAHRQAAIARRRWEHGLSSYLPVVTAEALVFEKERAVVRSGGQRAAAAVALVKSLGGAPAPGGAGPAPQSSSAPGSSNARSAAGAPFHEEL